LRRIARLEVSDPEIRVANAPWGYRAKITLTRTEPGSFGYHRYRPEGEVFPLATCRLAEPSVDLLWQALRERPDLMAPEAGRLMLRIDGTRGLHASAHLDRGRSWEKAEACARFLAGRGVAASLWVVDGQGRARQVAGVPAAIGAEVFEQVNPGTAVAVRDAAIEGLGPVAGTHVWDLYAGVGDSSIRLARAGARVSAVEVDRAAHQSATRGAGIKRFVGTVEGVAPGLGRPDLVLVNPPRRGLGRGVSATLLAAAPRRIVYVSCDPGTLARDVARLADGYRLETITAFDLFPQTAHVECVAVLEQR
jgi:23S rRNA (uracil1939-C5)-methyltransferase